MKPVLVAFALSFAGLPALAQGTPFADLIIADYLPRAFRHRYDADFLRAFLVCLVAVGLKMQLSGFHAPGCTAEACEFRDAYDTYRERGVEILGVSPDGVASHEKFKSKYELPFTLLADPDHSTAEAYGVWGERSFAGKKYLGINRSTFVIDKDGNVARAMFGIKPAGHAAAVLDELPG